MIGDDAIPCGVVLVASWIEDHDPGDEDPRAPQNRRAVIAILDLAPLLDRAAARRRAEA